MPRIDQLGPVKVIQNLVNSLGRFENIKIEVFCFDKYIDKEVRIGVPVQRIKCGSFRFSDYDIIHTNGIRPDCFAFINRKKIRYHISTIHNFVFEDLMFTYNRIISILFGYIWLMFWTRADKLICVSETMKTYYTKWFPEAKLGVIYNGIAETDKTNLPDNDIIQSINNFHSQGLQVLGSAAILTKRKGLDQVMHLLSADKQLAFIIIGNGKDLLSLKNLSEKLNLTDRCLFCGFRNNAVNYFGYFDFFIIPSRSEGFGLALVEAVQQKVPVICSDIKVFEELFDSSEVTFFTKGNSESLREALKMALKTGNNKVTHAYIRFINNYTALLMSRSYYNLYISAK